MNRRGTETQRENQITETVIGCAIEIHRALGPGLLESAYEDCLCYELKEAKLSFRRQVLLPLNYKGVKLESGYIMDVVAEDLIVIELKTVERILPVHEAQLITYLKLSGHSVGLLVNFNVALMKSGIRRLVNEFQETSASPRLRG